jgi:hypothetical protein
MGQATRVTSWPIASHWSPCRLESKTEIEVPCFTPPFASSFPKFGWGGQENERSRLGSWISLLLIKEQTWLKNEISAVHTHTSNLHMLCMPDYHV